jgi:hypothetical protein
MSGEQREREKKATGETGLPCGAYKLRMPFPLLARPSGENAMAMGAMRLGAGAPRSEIWMRPTSLPEATSQKRTPSSLAMARRKSSGENANTARPATGTFSNCRPVTPRLPVALGSHGRLLPA